MAGSGVPRTLDERPTRRTADLDGGWRATAVGRFVPAVRVAA